MSTLGPGGLCECVCVCVCVCLGGGGGRVSAGRLLCPAASESPLSHLTSALTRPLMRLETKGCLIERVEVCVCLCVSVCVVGVLLV